MNVSLYGTSIIKENQINIHSIIKNAFKNFLSRTFVKFIKQGISHNRKWSTKIVPCTKLFRITFMKYFFIKFYLSLRIWNLKFLFANWESLIYSILDNFLCSNIYTH